MSEINWGLYDASASQRGAEMSQGLFDKQRQEQTRRATGAALQALMANPNATPPALNDLAKLAPDVASQLIKFQQGQQDRSRDTQFRGAMSDYYSAGGGGAINALMPQAMASRPPMAAEAPPPISAAPPPPADWQERLGPGQSNAMTALASSPDNGVPSSRAQMVPVRTDGSPIVSVDPSTVDPNAGQGMAADMAGQEAPPAAMPPEIERAANSPDMGVRNAAFKRMMQIDPVQAMKIQSEERDRTLDGMEDANKAFRYAAEALGNARDDATYKMVLDRVEQAVAPLGIDIRSMVPGTHPGPEGIQQLQMQALDISQRFAAIDRRFSAEARAADIDADNQRADRNTDSLIADRSQRTGIQRQRAETAAEREARMAAGGGRRGGKPKKSRGGGAAPTAVNPATGERIEFRGGKWVPAK